MLPTNQQRTTAEDVEREASRYILHKLGDRLWADEPVYDEQSEQWTVPIHSRSLPRDVTLGHITLDAQGVIVRAPSRDDIRRAIEARKAMSTQPAPKPQFIEAATDSPSGGMVTSLLDAIRNALAGAPPFAYARGKGTTAEGAPMEEEPPLSLDALTQDLQNDPDFFTAVVNLRAALADPQLRPKVLQALELLARAAKEK
jgi:hypothetical protein